MSKLLTVKELQALLKIDRLTVYRMLKDGRLTGVKVGHQWRFSQDKIDSLLLGSPSTKKEAVTSIAPHALPTHFYHEELAQARYVFDYQTTAKPSS